MQLQELKGLGFNVVYYAGREMSSEFGVHPAGSIVTQAGDFHYLESLIRTHYLYATVKDSDFDKLPAEVYGLVMPYSEVANGQLRHLDLEEINKPEVDEVQTRAEKAKSRRLALKAGD